MATAGSSPGSSETGPQGLPAPPDERKPSGGTGVGIAAAPPETRDTGVRDPTATGESTPAGEPSAPGEGSGSAAVATRGDAAPADTTTADASSTPGHIARADTGTRGHATGGGASTVGPGTSTATATTPTATTPTATTPTATSGDHGPDRWRRAHDLPAISGHQGALDGIRAIAAFAVLVTHVAGQTAFSLRGSAASWATARGDVGVPIFFTLSGLLLFRPWVRALLEGRPWPKVRSYLWRRALRILPAYWAVVLVALPTLNRKHITSTWTWVQHLLLLQIYDPRPWWHGTGAPGLAQMWSLATEMAFYLVLPVLAMILASLACRGSAAAEKRARRLIIGLVAMGMCSFGYIVFVYLPHPKFWLEETLPQSLVWFACGMILSVVSVWAQVETNPDGPVNRFCRTVAACSGTCWLLAALVFAIACTPVAGPAGFAISTAWETETKTALYAIIGLMLVAPAALQPARETPMSRILGNRVMRFLGKISYAVYLWQFLLIIGFFNLLHLKDGFHHDYSGIDVAGLLVVIAVITAAAATVAYFLIEAPAQKLYGLVPQTTPRHAAKHRKQRRPWAPPAP